MGYERLPHQLPAGRHGLTREIVMDNQRSRILRAVVDVVGIDGFTDMTIDHVTAAAGVSRRTFYDYYDGKVDVFLAAYHIVATALLERVRAAYAEGGSGEERGERCLRAAAQFFRDDPAHADVFLVGALAAGKDAGDHRDRTMQELTALVDAAAALEPARWRPPAITALVVVGGINDVFVQHVRAGAFDALPALVPDLLYTAVLPYGGHERANRARLAAQRSAAHPATIA